MDIGKKIMDIQITEDLSELDATEALQYEKGHIDARFAASEIALKLEARAEIFEKLLRKSWEMLEVDPDEAEKMIQDVKDDFI